MFFVQADLKENPDIETMMHAVKYPIGERMEKYRIANVKVVRNEMIDDGLHGTVVEGDIVSTEV